MKMSSLFSMMIVSASVVFGGSDLFAGSLSKISTQPPCTDKIPAGPVCTDKVPVGPICTD